MNRLVAALLLVAAVLAVAGLATASTPLGLAALAVVGVAWLVRDFARSTHLATGESA